MWRRVRLCSHRPGHTGHRTRETASREFCSTRVRPRAKRGESAAAVGLLQVACLLLDEQLGRRLCVVEKRIELLHVLLRDGLLAVCVY